MAIPVITKRGEFYYFMLLDGPDDDIKIMIDDDFGYPTEENCRAVWRHRFPELNAFAAAPTSGLSPEAQFGETLVPTPLEEPRKRFTELLP